MQTLSSKYRPKSYSFGSSINTRSFSAGSGFRFGFNTQEKDKEIYNNNETYTATFWEYDGRLGRRWNLDPKSNALISNYTCNANNPICFSDPFGDTIKTNQEGFNTINEGLTATLGKDHGFSFDKDKGIISNNEVKDKSYTKDQQEIINRYTKIINDKKIVNVQIVDYNEESVVLNGKSLADYNFNGATVSSKNSSILTVLIARNPHKLGELPNPMYNSLNKNTTPEMIPGYVITNTYYRGVATLHELGGHAYFRITQPDITLENHNKLVESFETNFRQFYMIGTYKNKGEVKKAIKSGLNVQLGAPIFLEGFAGTH